MKKIISLFSIAVLLLHANIFAQNDNEKDGKKTRYEFVKNKTFTKSYGVGNDKVSVENSFGKVEVKTWGRNEVKVDVSIEVSSNVETVAQKIIDGIDINTGNKSGEVWFKTNNKGSNTKKGENSTMTIDYVVYMPASNPLKISNEFGATIIPDFKGEVDLSSKFGSLKTGSLSDIKNVAVEFGKGTFESLANGKVEMKYSNGEFGKLAGNIKLNLEFCGSTKINVDNSLTNLDVKASYSTLNLRPVGEPSASYNISTSFGSFKNRTSIKFDGDGEGTKESPKFDYNYSGRSGSGSIPVKVTTSFSTIILGEPNADDMKEREKNKGKEKNKNKDKDKDRTT